MVAFDDGDGPALFQDRLEGQEGCNRIGQVLQNETQKHVVERGRGKRKVQNIGLTQGDVGHPVGPDHLPGNSEGGFRDVDGGNDGLGTLAGQGHGLGATPHPASRTVCPAG